MSEDIASDLAVTGAFLRALRALRPRQWPKATLRIGSQLAAFI